MKTLGQKIKELRKQLHATQKQIATAVGVSHVTISQWEKGETSPKGENLYKLAEALGCDAKDLINSKVSVQPVKVIDLFGGKGDMNVIPAVANFKKIPIISWVQAGMWTECIEEYPSDWRYSSAKVSDRAFALKVVGDSMTNPTGFPSIPEGSFVIVDPDAEWYSGSIVVAKLTDSDEATLKKIVVDGPNTYLVPLNPNYRAIQVNGNCKIVGVVKKMEVDF